MAADRDLSPPNLAGTAASASHKGTSTGRWRPPRPYGVAIEQQSLAYSRAVPELVDVDLTDDERAVLACGLSEWGGPATPTDEIARLLGFTDVRALRREGGRIARALRSDEGLTAADWRRAVASTELVFASDLVGSGVDWSATTGFDDAETIRLLRSIQCKLVSIVRST